MNRNLSYLKVLFLCSVLLLVMFTGCIEEEQELGVLTETSLPEVQLDQPSILPDWKDGEYHDYYGTTQMLNNLNDMEIGY
ncbi:MAG: hypothetical protein JSW06_10990 [Thermoplasmatales archaeon]|nr:MAG: hypothetical protein JSW06_10990 [Thermoplasmatales archaeon]